MPFYRLRAAQGVLGLAEQHNPGRLEAACARAIDAGDPSYKTIRGILAVGTETQPTATAPPAARAGAFLRGPAQIFSNVLPFPTAAPVPPRTRPPRHPR
jgi:hypothetical protein